MQSKSVGAASASSDDPNVDGGQEFTKPHMGCGCSVGVLLILVALGSAGSGWGALLGVVGFLLIVAMFHSRHEKGKRVAQEELRAEAAAKVEAEFIATKKLQDEVVATIKKHGPILRRKRLQLVRVDDYGNRFTDAWEREVEYFLNHVISPVAGDLMLDTRQAEWVRSVIEWASQKSTAYGDSPDVASMDPIEYEHYCAELLRNAGWEARVTTASGDQGVDVIATRDGKTLVVQAKRYSGSVGNAAVQEAFAGKQFVGADLAAVVSPAPFTKSAVELANTTGVLLLHHDGLRTL